MQTKDLYFISCNDIFLLKVSGRFPAILSREDVEALGYGNLKFTERGTMEEDLTVLYTLKSAVASEMKSAEGFEWIPRKDLFNREYRPGDRLYIAELTGKRKNIDLVVRYDAAGEKITTAYDRGHMNFFKAFYKHLHTINRHRRLVRRQCFQVGLYWQGLIHDLSKYSPTEFWVGVRYFQGMRSPNVAERMEKGYSQAWLHHKGRNRHHQEYWTDYSYETGNILEFVTMPKKYLVESMLDRIAACKVYRGKNYNDGAALDYLLTRDSESHMNRGNYDEMVFIFTMLRDKGEKETFRFLKHEYLKK